MVKYIHIHTLTIYEELTLVCGKQQNQLESILKFTCLCRYYLGCGNFSLFVSWQDHLLIEAVLHSFEFLSLKILRPLGLVLEYGTRELFG